MTSPDAVFYPEPGHEAEFITLQQQMVATYGGPKGVLNAISAGYFIPPHLGAVISHSGFALGNWRDLLWFGQDGHHAARINLTSPTLLLYAPLGEPAHVPFGQQGTFDDVWPDPPYELIGWAYGAVYDPGNPPRVPGIPRAAWFVHETGWHMWDGTQILTPPQEDCAGQVAPLPPSPPSPTFVNAQGTVVSAITGHARAWDLHVWRNPDLTQVPIMTLEEPFGRLPSETLDLPDGAFFYPAFGVRPGWESSAAGSSQPRCP
jgi:hypothetical protein